MPENIELDVILSGICTSHESLRKETVENIRQAVSHLKPKMFSGVDAPIYELIIKYFLNYNGLIDKEAFLFNLQNKGLTIDRQQEYEVRFVEIYERNIRRDKFVAAVYTFASNFRNSRYLEVLTDAVKKVDGTEEAYSASRKLLDLGVAEIDEGVRSGNSTTNLRSDSKSFLALFKKRKRDPGSDDAYLPFGIPFLDDELGGITHKNLVFLSGYTGHFKSTTSKLICYHNFLNGKNIVVGQGEVTESEFRNGLYSLHSTHPKFNLGVGITKDQIKFPHKYKDQADLEENLSKVVDDFSTNPEYGNYFQFTFPPRCVVGDLDRILRNYQTAFNIDMFVLDEIRHIAAVRRGSYREEFGSVILEMDRLVKTFNGGIGLRCICLHKVNRRSFEFAQENGYYELSSLAESDESEKCANLSIWTLQTSQMETDNELKIGVNKSRDGRKNFSHMMYVDGKTGLIGEKS